MQFAFDTHYTPEEWAFIRSHNCTILSEISPRRVGLYRGGFIPTRRLWRKDFDSILKVRS